MARATRSPLHQQLTRISRRLFVQTLLDSLAWCWAGAILAATAWFLADPFVTPEAPEWLRWAVAGGLFGLGTVLAVVLAVLRAPSKLAAALTLDERFGLKERVTTSLTLPPALLQSSAGQALLEDVNTKVANLDVGARFPVRVRWTAALILAGALLLAAVALFYEPQRTQAKPPPVDSPTAQGPANKAEIEQKARELEKKLREKRDAEKAKGDKPDGLDEELKKILNKPRDTQEDIRERVKDLTRLEDKIKQRQDALAEKAQAIKDQLQQLNKMASMDPKNGPAKELQKAIEKGDFKKAQEEVERLAKKLQDKEQPMTEEEKEQLRKQLQDMKEKLERAAKPNLEEERRKLEELVRQGKIDQEQMEKALDKIKKNAERMSQADREKLEEIAEQLKQCEQCMKQGDSDKAADALKKAAQAMRKMDDLDELRELEDQLDQLRDVKNCMCRGMNGNPVPAQGRRPDGDPHDTGSYNTRVRSQFDASGQMEQTGFAPGTSFKKRSSSEIAGEIKQASQEAPEAIERQRIPRAASDMARGYFENFRKLSGDEEKKDK